MFTIMSSKDHLEVRLAGKIARAQEIDRLINTLVKFPSRLVYEKLNLIEEIAQLKSIPAKKA